MRPWVALAAAGLLVATGCGGDGSATDGRSPESSPVVPAPTAPPSPTPTPDLDGFRARLVRVATLEQPLALASRPGDSALYIAQKTGQVVAIDGRARPILDLSSEVSTGTEQGLLGLVFSPDGGFLYINYTDVSGDTHVTELRMRGDRPLLPTRRDVLVVDQPYSNHNGGHLAFGPDGYLYIGLGDGGSGGDPEDHAQDLGSLLGKMLRIDPRPGKARPYGIPEDNPFVGREGARPEIWAYGLRNPWRYSFDRLTGELWIADVGQGEVEEIDLQPDPQGGHNYGWDGYEGSLVFEEPVPEDAVGPVHEYGRDLGATVIGGHVYRGSRLAGLQGAYVFGDYFNPDLRALVPRGDGYREVPLGLRVPDLVAFGEDPAGELYALSLSGDVYRLAPGS